MQVEGFRGCLRVAMTLLNGSVKSSCEEPLSGLSY